MNVINLLLKFFAPKKEVEVLEKEQPKEEVKEITEVTPPLVYNHRRNKKTP